MKNIKVAILHCTCSNWITNVKNGLRNKQINNIIFWASKKPLRDPAFIAVYQNNLFTGIYGSYNGTIETTASAIFQSTPNRPELGLAPNASLTNFVNLIQQVYPSFNQNTTLKNIEFDPNGNPPKGHYFPLDLSQKKQVNNAGILNYILI